MPKKQSLGKKIRNQRKAHRLTLVQMAENCNISPSFLSQIERDQATPSVTTLYAIAEVLSVSMASFFTEPDTEDPSEIPLKPIRQINAKVVRADHRKTLIYPGSNIINELLTPDLQGAIQMMWIVMPPGTDTAISNPTMAMATRSSTMVKPGWASVSERLSMGDVVTLFHQSGTGAFTPSSRHQCPRLRRRAHHWHHR